MTQKTMQNPWTMDVRVRERNLKSGALTDKDLDKYLSGLADVADQAEAFSLAQPALTESSVPEPPESEPAPSGDGGTDGLADGLAAVVAEPSGGEQP